MYDFISKMLNKLGTIYGGWDIPMDAQLDENSIIYSGGVGEDISFDLILQHKYDSNIVLIDPTKRAKVHYNQVKEFYKTREYNFSGDIQTDYLHHIMNLKPNLSKFTYLDLGLHKKKDLLKFYKQHNEKYVSQSLVSNMFSDKFDLVEVDTIKNIMSNLGHSHIDLLKLDIEGSEVEVLNNMLDDKILPKYLCIEFDLLIKNKDTDNLTRSLIKRLEGNGYKILINNDFNITFELN